MSEKQKLLSVDEMLSADDVYYATTPAFGGMIRFGSLNAGEVIEHNAQNEGPAKRTAGIRLIIRSLVDAEGRRIGKMEQLDKWKTRSLKTMNKLVDVVYRLNGLTTDGVDISPSLRAAGTDPEKLTALIAELRALADKVESAGVDKTKLDAILNEPATQLLETAKNVSSEVNSGASPSDSH